MSAGEWAGIIIGGLALIGVIYRELAQRGLRRADAASKLTGAALEMMEELRKRVDDLEGERDELKAENARLRVRVRTLENELRKFQNGNS
jgi:predicted RNase H-like nuclease (RuvC/YqgF family)